MNHATSAATNILLFLAIYAAFCHSTMAQESLSGFEHFNSGVISATPHSTLLSRMEQLHWLPDPHQRRDSLSQSLLVDRLRRIKKHEVISNFNFSIITPEKEEALADSSDRQRWRALIAEQFSQIMKKRLSNEFSPLISLYPYKFSTLFIVHLESDSDQIDQTATIYLLKMERIRTSPPQLAKRFEVSGKASELAARIAEKSLETLIEEETHAW